MRSFPPRVVLAALLLAGLALPAQAGATKGPVRKTYTVQGFHTLTVKVAFQAGKPATVQVQGDGDTPLGIVVLDADGKRVAVDGKNPDNPSARWVPTQQGTYRIKIVNRGGVPNRIILRTN
jgi:hypothetical protein